MGSERKRSLVAVSDEDDVAKTQDEPEISDLHEAKILPKFRRLLPLLPKGKTTSASRQSERSVTRHPGPCGIRACEKLSCNLESHRRYIKAYGVQALQKRNTSSTDGSNEKLAASRSHTTTPQIQKTIAKSAGFPVLPLSQTDASDPNLQYLFHEFFENQLTTLLKLIVVPFNGYDAWARKRHEHLFDMGTQIELDCLNFVASAYLYILGHSPIPEAQSAQTAMMVHSHILKGLIGLLGDFKPDRDTDRVLSIMYTLVMFALLEPEKSMTALLSHKRAMVRVVESCGGLHNVGPNLTLTISLDRMIATVTETECVYSSWAHVKLPIQRAPKHPAIYGSFFSDQGNVSFPEDVRAYCAETCRAIEIIEGEEWDYSAEPTSNNTSGEVYFLYYLRDRIAGQFVHLNARMAQEASVARCALLATKLVECAVLWSNYNIMLPFVIADRLIKILVKQDLLTVWEGSEDMLKWVLFGLTCVSEYWKGRGRAVSLCRKIFVLLFNGHWPEDWREKQKLLVCRFVWSSRLDAAFASACEELNPSLPQ